MTRPRPLPGLSPAEIEGSATGSIARCDAHEPEMLDAFRESRAHDDDLSREQFRDFQLPDWASRLFKEGHSEQEILRRAFRYLLGAPSPEVHMAVELIINEVCQSEDGSRAIAGYRTQHFLDKLSRIHSREADQDNPQDDERKGCD